MAAPFRVELPVRFSEVDLYQIVWHGHYVVWFEEARNALASSVGFSLVDDLARGYRYPIVELSVSYRKPARLGDRVAVFPRYVPEPIARITFEYELRNAATGEKLASAVTRQAILRGDELLLTKPAALTAILERLAAVQAAWA